MAHCERRQIAVSGASEHRHGLDAPADQPTGHVHIAHAGVKQSPPARGVEGELDMSRVVLPRVEPTRSVELRRPLGNAGPDWLRRDIDSGNQWIGHSIRRFHQVLTVQSSDARHRRRWQQQR